jgi:uncharacterized membrane protein YebE (DUF533 family)
MFNAEKLLGQVIREVIGTGKSHKKRGKSSLLGGLTSGAGLMTVIGLGVGAFEILKDKQNQAAAGGYAPQPQSQPPPPPNWGGAAAASPPPPPPPRMPAAAGVPPQAPLTVTSPAGTEQLAIRMIQVMIAAAHADGSLDEAEEQAILERAGRAGLSQEERLFLLDELHKPKTIADLTAGIADPSVAKTMYILAAGTISIDTEVERLWLDQLASGLGLSKAVQGFIEEQG